ncbi:MAG: hypothetical protein GY927_22760 [bacterium]|nr:hypothetical protein [bacterium]
MTGGRSETILEKYPKSWQLSAHGTPIWRDETLLAPVSTAFGPAMLKRASEGKSFTTSSSLLRWYEGSGSANILKKQKNVQLLEWIDGPALSNLVDEEEDNQAIDTLSDVIAKLQAPKRTPLKARLIPLGSTMHPLLAQKYSENLVHRHGARLIRHLLQTTKTPLPLHGNLHFDKVMHHSKRGWLTIAPQGICGDLHYEFASALCHKGEQRDSREIRLRLSTRATRIANNLSLNKDRLLTFAFCHACLKSIEAARDSENATHWSDMSVLLLDNLVP